MIQGKLHEKIMLGVPIENLEEQLERQVHHALRILAPYLNKMKTNQENEK